MRIIGGRLKGRSLKGPASQAIRPTSDRLRETLFNILAHSYGDPVEDARVLDVYAGTGALGLEALSRGARFACFVEQGAEACALIRANVETLRLGDAVHILRRDARKLGTAAAQDRFNLAFLDPPYGKGLAAPTLAGLRDGGWLAEGALLVIEETAQAEIALPEGFNLIDARSYGDTQIVFARFR
ncbi:16S rRNA (guanine(966)-N(2))-methyltransferase RsmD [Methylocapsa acidiphila]|uniref:16S rRNA (guanine(966)-N(2))-methyltransferase RsmD n=1 Tax=Methylocapsa acidiphila TaxID=133552 RepID=UPI0003FF9185|nr:16S rRNA (guanine(966)-N(2))-methyltransferase RsmD [Methylocapsa acidiphila]